MIGISMDELYERISHLHEAEFEYNGTTYVLQPEIKNEKHYLVIWDCVPGVAKCIARHKINQIGDIPHSVIDTVLSEKCFDGKSFKEVEKYITVTGIQ